MHLCWNAVYELLYRWVCRVDDSGDTWYLQLWLWIRSDQVNNQFIYFNFLFGVGAGPPLKQHSSQTCWSKNCLESMITVIHYLLFVYVTCLLTEIRIISIGADLLLLNLQELWKFRWILPVILQKVCITNKCILLKE